MGRPLFSSLNAPAVRAEPEPAPAPASYENWSYWKPFDPDSDEFFDNDDAVYEAFLDPALPPDERRIAPGLYFERSSSTDGSSSSSGSSTPDSDILSVGEIQMPVRQRRAVPPSGNSEEVFELDAPRRRALEISVAQSVRVPSPPTEEPRAYQPGEMVSQYANMYNVVSAPAPERRRRSPPPAPQLSERTPTYIEYPSSPVSDHELLPADAEMEVEIASRSSPPPLETVSVPTTPVRPTTPPSHSPYAYPQTPTFHGSPSPPPSVTPRLYSWRPAHPASPVPAGPLTNRGARRSVAHITTPALVPVHRMLF